MSVVEKNGGKRASKATCLFTTSALLLVVLVSLSFPVPADAGRRPPYFKTKPLSPPPKKTIYMPPAPLKKSPPPVPKKSPSYVPSIPPKKPVTPMKPKSSPPPYKPDLTTASKFPTIIPKNWIPKVPRKLPPTRIPGFGNIPFGIPPPPDLSPYRLRNPPPPRFRYRRYPGFTPPRYGRYPRYPPPRN